MAMPKNIRKIVSLKGIGRFLNYSPRGDVEWGKLTIFYGENGKGKTTLGAILRSLATGDSDIISGRKTIGYDIEPAVNILADGGTLAYANGRWNSQLNTFRIFDQSFVSENIFDGQLVGSTQKRNLYRVIVGVESVRLAAELDSLTKSNSDIQREMTQRGKSIQSFLQGVSLADFIKYVPADTLSQEINDAETQLNSKKAADALLKRAGLDKASLPEPPGGLSAFLALTIADVSGDVERRVREHRQLHHMKPSSEDWLAKGMEFDRSQGCPFCGQSLEGAGLIQLYEAYFSESYQALKQNVIDIGTRVKKVFGETEVATICQQLVGNQDKCLGWIEQAKVSRLPDLDVEVVSGVLAGYREAVLALLRLKAGAPLEIVPMSEDAQAAINSFSRLQDEFGSYNKRIEITNGEIASFKALLKALDEKELNARLAKLRCLARRKEAGITEQCNNLIELDKTKRRQEERREVLRVSLDGAGTAFTRKYRQRVNRYLEKFGTSFRIGDVNHNYVGGVNAKFDIVINDAPISLGDESTPVAKPSFKNTLSAGDKSTLALAFFLAQLEEDDLRERIVVFDDPFTSQDRFRATQTQLEIIRVAGSAAQTVLFSHDAQFAVDVWERSQGRIGTKALRINGIGTDISTISECDIANLTKASWVAQTETLQRFCNEGIHSGVRAEDAVQKLRPVLEAYCRMTCPTHFKDADMLGTIIGTIEREGSAQPLFPLVGELNDINEFSKRYHHDDGTITGPLDETELIAFAGRVLRIVGAL